MIKNVEKLFLKAINPWGQYARLYETGDGFIFNGHWAVIKEVFDRYNLPYQNFIINKLENRTVKTLFNEIIEDSLKVFNDVQFSLSKQKRISGKRKTVYYFDSKELQGILILKIYADFLCVLCRSSPTLYIMKDGWETKAYFVWFEKNELIAICAGIPEN
jgi:hypothetical protein